MIATDINAVSVATEQMLLSTEGVLSCASLLTIMTVVPPMALSGEDVAGAWRVG